MQKLDFSNFKAESIKLNFLAAITTRKLHVKIFKKQVILEAFDILQGMETILILFDSV